jgi:hypothetical protein
MTPGSSGEAGSQKQVDQNALRFNQAMIVGLVVLAFVLGTGNGGAWIVLAVGLAMAVGVAMPGKGPFQALYRRVIVPLGLIRPKPEVDSPSPHRFAQAMGAVCLLLASSLLFAGFSLLGWTVAWLVVALALVNLLFGFCAGCFIFLHLERLRLREAAAR